MSIEDNKAIVGRWFTEFWGPDFNPAVIDELAHPDIRFEYSLHEPLRGREAVRQFATGFRACSSLTRSTARAYCSASLPGSARVSAHTASNVESVTAAANMRGRPTGERPRWSRGR